MPDTDDDDLLSSVESDGAGRSAADRHVLGVARDLIRELRRKDARQYELAVAEGRRIRTETGDIAVDVAERTFVLRALAELRGRGPTTSTSD